MNRLIAASLSIVLVSCIGGCKNSQQQIEPSQTSSRDPGASREQRSPGDEDYNGKYQAESHHRHHHGRRGETPDDNWGTYDRTDDGDAPASRAEVAGGSSQTRFSRHHNSRALTAAPGKFDFYVLNLSWSPEFCHGHPSAAECSQHRAFTLHGLWPQNNDGTYPEDCSDAPGPANPSQYADIYPDASLLQHEWQTHGTCSGLAPDQFLTLDRRAEHSITIPTALAHLKQQASMTPAQIVTLFTQSNAGLPASSLAITCGNNFLTAVEVCMDKNLKPESCSAVKTCGANQIRIPAPQ
ncbi:ribonuclease T2 family protein [Terriglobus roseus]|nr:ribonuclease T2 [Terriglobus roseus]